MSLIDEFWMKTLMLQGLTGIAILLIPIGVPFTFMLLMKRAKDRVGGVNTTALGGAKLASDSTEDDDDSFGYLCKDCKPQYYCATAMLSHCCIMTNSTYCLALTLLTLLCYRLRNCDVFAQIDLGWPVDMYVEHCFVLSRNSECKTNWNLDC